MFDSEPQAMAANAENWRALLDPKGSAANLSSKTRWRVLRQGMAAEHALPDEGWHWQVERAAQGGLSESLVAKLILRSRAHGDACETVVMVPRFSRGTVCVSSQIGCGVGCTFCATGRMGLLRDLSATEILEQVVWARRQMHAWSPSPQHAIPLRNIVFMGMGEPLHNASALHQALAWLCADRGFGFSPRRITVSTAGVPAKMIDLVDRFPRLRVALSLHAATPKLRRRLVPRATADLDALRHAIAEMNRLDPSGPVWIEIALIAGVNDSIEDALAVHRFCEGLRVEINVVPYNDISHAKTSKSSEAPILAAPTRERLHAFVATLRSCGWYTTVRNTLGDSIQAACGQLVTGIA
ncbi:MAG: radical SAM protein [Pirellula sp.]